MVDCCKATNKMNKVRLRQRALYRKAKQEQEVKFYSLDDKVCRLDVLWQAWPEVKANKGAPGIDGKTIKDIIKEGEAAFISALQAQLLTQSYQFASVRIVTIPKGGTRSLGIATVSDRVVQTAMKIVIEPIFEASFHNSSYGYRPQRNAEQASNAIWKDLYRGAKSVIEIDFKAYFASITHDKLLILISSRIAAGSMLKLIKQTLTALTVKDDSISLTKVGVAQGSPLSPLYANIYLNVIDQVWHKRGYPEKLGAIMYRYCDDIILICRSSTQPALEAFTAIAND